MILINETIRKFGYNPYEVSGKSTRKIMVECPCCKNIRAIKMVDYRISVTKYCHACFLRTDEHKSRLKKNRDDRCVHLTRREQKRIRARKSYHKNKNNPEYRLIKNLRNSIHGAIHYRLKAPRKKYGAFRNLPYTKDELVNHINNKLKERNYICPLCKKADLKNGYEIDHRIPLSKAKTIEEIILLFSLENLDVLCRFCNRSKHDKLIEY